MKPLQTGFTPVLKDRLAYGSTSCQSPRFLCVLNSSSRWGKWYLALDWMVKGGPGQEFTLSVHYQKVGISSYHV